MPEVNLKGTVVIVDEVGAKLLTTHSKSKWAAKKINGKVYIHKQLRSGGEYVGYESLHRVLTNCPEGLMVDHVNGNTLDNRLSNLRVCNHSENMRNRKMHKNNASGFKGVYFSKSRNKWIAQITSAGKKMTLGSFNSPEVAHNAYVLAAKKYHGEFARAA